MANFKRALEVVKRLEFSSCANALHKNEGEEGYTFMGIYQKAHPYSLIWKRLNRLKRYLGIKNPTPSQLRKLSYLLCRDKEVLKEVERIYKEKYWDRAKLDKVRSQQIANEIFVFGVNAGMDRAIRLAQKIVGVKPDGVVGRKTLRALNRYNSILFDFIFDAGEIWHYLKLSLRSKKYSRYFKGWVNRAIRV